MSTKRNPGPFDCYAKLADDEPYFVLRAKGPMAAVLVELWARLRELQYEDYPKLKEAHECSDQMRRWRAAKVAREPLPAQD